jgi:hypothetical protein
MPPMKQPETHIPAALHTLPPLVHGVPALALAMPGTPFVQIPLRQGFELLGVLVSSMTVVTPPSPLHSAFWQVPCVCMLVGTPASANDIPQRLPIHVRCSHDVSLPGQSVAC